MYKSKLLIIVLISTIQLTVTQAGPLLPLHTIEGNSGVCLRSTAYLANPPEEGEIFGKPSVSVTEVLAKEKDLQSLAVTQNIYGQFEIGDDDLGGLLDTLDSDHSRGIEFTAVASKIKTIKDFLPRPVILSAGLRNGDAIQHTGFFGFAGERETTVESCLITFLTNRLAFAVEYRQKANVLDEFSTGGYGNLANHRESNV